MVHIYFIISKAWVASLYLPWLETKVWSQYSFKDGMENKQ